MTENRWTAIRNKIGEAAAAEMVAEEAAELSAAAAKFARIVRGDNPSRMEFRGAVNALMEEVADTLNALDVLDSGEDMAYALYAGAHARQGAKMTRWYNSLFGEEAKPC